MSQYERNLDYLIKHRIVWRRDPITDKPTEVYEWGKYYENGTHQCYTLFNSRAQINTLKSLKWHLYVLWYLNPQMDQDELYGLAKYICNKQNGFITFSLSEHILNNIVYDVSLMDLDQPPPNKLRKIIFNEFTGLTVSEKLSIVGQIIGRNKISESEIYDAMLMINDNGDTITVKGIADYLGCSTRTVYRNMSNELKKEKELLNKN